MHKKFLYCFITFCLCLSCVAAEEVAVIDDDINQFIKLLSESVNPSLADYYRFYGRGAEGELQLVLRQCEKDGWVPALANSDCLAFIKERETTPDQTVSLYFKWLKRRLPIAPNVSILKIERIQDKDIVDHELIHATLDSTRVIFFRPIGIDIKVPFGHLGISQINGVPVHQLLQKDIQGLKAH